MTQIQINGCTVEVARKGRGEPVVLLHASGSSSAQWRSLADQLADRYLTLAPDLYGYGCTSPWPGYGEFRLADEAALVLGLMDTLPGPVHLVGHSYGGAVALQVARARPRGLRSLTLVEPVAFHLLRQGDAADHEVLRDFTEAGQAVVRSLCRGDHHGGFGAFFDHWNGPGAWAGMPLERRAAMAANPGKLILEYHALTTEPCRIVDLAGITAPIQLLQGSRTRPSARRVCERLARAWPQALMHVITGAGHMAPLTHREPVNALIAAHLDAHADAHAPAALSLS